MTRLPAAAPKPSDLHPEQLVKGVLAKYKAYARAEKAYRLCNEVINGNRRMPIMYVPLGDDDRLEFDLESITKDIKDPEARKTVINEVLGQWNNHFAAMYSRGLQELTLVSRNAYVTLSGLDIPPDLFPDTTFEAITGIIHKIVTDHLERETGLWLQFSAPQGSDMSLKLPTGGSVTLSRLLTMGGVNDEAAAQAVMQQLSKSSLDTAKENLVSCLHSMAAATARAYQIAQGETNPAA